MEQPEIPEGNVDDVFEFPEKEVQSDHYEIMVLVAGDATEEDAQRVFDEVKQEIAAHGGTITLEEALGRRSLGYTVEQSKSGNYFVAEFDMEKRKLKDLNEKLRIHKDVTRSLVVKKRQKTEEELADEKKRDEQRKAHKQQRLQEQMREEEEKQKEKEKEIAPKPVKKVSTEAAAEKPKEEVEKKKSIEDIDAEIDKLLSEDLDI
ncbi:MAG: 30S ribosomal protein S6 [Candidatus Kerfeldbacteria bacterium]